MANKYTVNIKTNVMYIIYTGNLKLVDKLSPITLAPSKQTD